MNPSTPPVALILGASGTLGGAIGRELIAQGCNTALHFHNNEAACGALLELSDEKSLKALSYAADFSDPAAPGALVSAVLKDFQRVDALIWAAGILCDAPVISLDEDDLRQVLNVNLRALFLVIKGLSRQFLKQKSGSVVALSSHAALSGRMGGAAYAMAQSGLLALLKSAAREWGGVGIRINAVLPPFVPNSGMGRQASPEFTAAAQERQVLKSHAGGASTTARVVVEVLCNPAISGQVLTVDSRVVI